MAGALLLSAPACDTTGIEDAIDNFALVIELKPINTNVTVQLLDAATGELIDNNLDVTFSGPDGSQVINFYSDPMADRLVKNGILNFGIANSRVPSPGSPVQVTITAKADAFLPASRTVEIPATGNHVFQIPVVRRSAPPSGVILASIAAGTASADGVTQQDIVASADNPDNPDDARAGFFSAAGSLFLDAEGQPLTGNLRVETVYYDPADPNSMGALPVQLPAVVDGEAFVLEGGLSLQITDASGRVAAILDSAAQSKIKHSLAAGTGSFDNPLFQNQLVWIGTPNPNPPAALVQYETEPLSELPSPTSTEYGWAFDLGEGFKPGSLIAIGRGNSVFCSQTFTVNRNGNEGTLKVRISRTGLDLSGAIQPGTSSITFNDVVPGSISVQIEAPSTTTLSQFDLVCPTSTPAITLDAPPANLIDSTVEVVLQCDQAGEKVRVTDIPSASVLYRKRGAPSGTAWQSATNLTWNYNTEEQALMGGSLRVADVEQGETYTFKLSFDDYVKQADVLISGANVVYNQVIQEDICR